MQQFPPSVFYPAWLLIVYLIYSQAIPAFHYDWGVQMGTQDSSEIVTEVGVAFWYGFCVADILVYIPALFLALLNRNKPWASTVLAAALGMTLYWPILAMVAVYRAQSGAPGWVPHDVSAYYVVLPIIMVWAMWALYKLGCPSPADTAYEPVTAS